MVAALSYYRLGATYPRDRLRGPYPERGREEARRRAELVAGLGSPEPEPPAGTVHRAPGSWSVPSRTGTWEARSPTGTWELPG